MCYFTSKLADTVIAIVILGVTENEMNLFQARDHLIWGGGGLGEGSKKVWRWGEGPPIDKVTVCMSQLVPNY